MVRVQFGDHVELSDEGSDFTSFGIGAVLGRNFVA
jgi:hypothetical protein